MRLAGLNKKALQRIQKAAQWDVNDQGEAVPLGSSGTPSGPAGGSGDVTQQLQQLDDKINQQNSVVQEWLDYLNQYNSGMSESINEMWTDVNTIADDVTLLKEKVQPTQLPAQQQPPQKTQPNPTQYDNLGVI
jgi:hypothetical protein